MSDTELCYLSATEAIAGFRRRELSPVELMRAIIARAEAVEPQVNAFANTYFDEALEKASRAEAKYMKGRARALEGPAARRQGHNRDQGPCDHQGLADLQGLR